MTNIPRTLAVAILIGLATAGCSGGGEAASEEASAPPSNIVRLDSAALAAAEVVLDSVRVVESSTLEATGTLSYDQNAVAKVGPKAEGRIVRVVHDLGDRVGLGTPLAILESQEVADVQAEVGRARAEADLARQNYEREQRLYQQKVSSQKEMLEARAAYESAVADLEAATAKLRTLGAAGTDVTGFSVSSPVAGTVVERNAVVGQIADPQDQLFTVADLSQLWLITDVYEKDLSRVEAGQDVRIRTQAFRDAVFHGHLAYVGQVVDPESHTVKARVIVDNPGRLRPGMFAISEIVLPEPDGTLAVPQEAVQELRGDTVVFVPEGGGRFRAIPIRTGPRVAGGLIIVRSGLVSGQRVVGNGSFFLKSELLKATFGDVD